MMIEYRQLNKQTIMSCWPSLFIKESFDTAQQIAFFSNNRYDRHFYQLPMDDKISKLHSIQHPIRIVWKQRQPNVSFSFFWDIFPVIIAWKSIQRRYQPIKCSQLQQSNRIKSFLGFCSYYRRFVETTRLLREARETFSSFARKLEVKLEFKTLQSRHPTNPLTALPSVKYPIMLYIYASLTAMGVSSRVGWKRPKASFFVCLQNFFQSAKENLCNGRRTFDNRYFYPKFLKLASCSEIHYLDQPQSSTMAGKLQRSRRSDNPLVGEARCL